MAVACHKLGVVLIPATYLLTARDIEYRCNNVNIKIIFSIAEDYVINHIKEALPNCKSIQKIYTIHKKENFNCLLDELEKSSNLLPPYLPKPMGYRIGLCMCCHLWITRSTAGEINKH